MNRSKAALIILDGWGIGAGDSSDGIHLANTPVMDQLMREQPICRLFHRAEIVAHVGVRSDSKTQTHAALILLVVVQYWEGKTEVVDRE